MPVDGVEFYTDREEIISKFEKASWTETALSLLQSWGEMLTHYSNKAPLVIRGVKMSDNYTQPPENCSSKKLIICLHGRNSDPIQFKQIVQEIEAVKPEDTHIYIPYVRKKGNSKLDKMVMPLLQSIEVWAKTSEDKELVLIGISNGGRIAHALETELLKSETCKNIKKLRFVSIVGACQGSTMANLAHKLHLGGIINKNIFHEMPLESERNQRLKEEWKTASKNPPLDRSYFFIASPHDWMVPNYSSSLMETPGCNANYAIIRGHGHNSIVNATAKAVATIVTDK